MHSTRVVDYSQYHEKPVPIKYLKPQSQNGKVKIIKPADPEKLAAYRASEKQFKNSKKFNKF